MRLGKGDHEKFFTKPFEEEKAKNKGVTVLSHAGDAILVKLRRIWNLVKTGQRINNKNQLIELNRSIAIILLSAAKENENKELTPKQLSKDVEILQAAVIQATQIIHRLRGANADKKQLEIAIGNLNKLDSALKIFEIKNKSKNRTKTPATSLPNVASLLLKQLTLRLKPLLLHLIVM